MKKARNENGNIFVYSEEQMKQKFNRFQLANGSDVNLFYASAKEVLEEYGFFDIVIPTLMSGERLGAIYFDIPENVFAYPIEQIPIPPPKTAEELQQEYLDSETEKYRQRTKDGANAYAKISAEFRLAKLSGGISEEAHAVIESTLIPVRNEVLAGQWISGLRELESIGSGIIGIDLYTRLLNQFNDYIAANYND